ncbi:MAG: hypothetical protein FWE54_04150 [Methanimicrococcus sp.]|nr:hypothetical protein [Methanimicrococcus sp.]
MGLNGVEFEIDSMDLKLYSSFVKNSKPPTTFNDMKKAEKTLPLILTKTD